MMRIATVAVAGLVSLSALAATAPSASAQSFSFGGGSMQMYGGNHGPHGGGHWRPRSGISLNFSFGTPYYPYYAPYPPPPPPPPHYGGNWQAHVWWCHQRYRSYQESINAYKGYDGYWHTCHSPYG
jgi:hypothetical protein